MEARTIDLLESLLLEHIGGIEDQIEEALSEGNRAWAGKLLEALAESLDMREDFKKWRREHEAEGRTAEDRSV